MLTVNWNRSALRLREQTLTEPRVLEAVSESYLSIRVNGKPAQSARLKTGDKISVGPYAVEVVEAPAGVNLAILYGFGLIISALVLALIYGALCRPEDDSPPDAASGKQSPAAGEGDK